MRKRILVGSVFVMTGLVVSLAVGQVQRPVQDDEQAIRKSADAYSAAYNKGDLDALMAHWAADADFIDDSGQVYKGRDAIAALFKKHMAGMKGFKLKLQISSLRILKSEVAVEDGKAELTSPEGAVETSRYTAIWTKTNGKWLLSSVRDLPNETETAPASPASRLKELEWLVGDWVNEDKSATVQVSCRWTLNKNFLVQEYTVKSKDGEDLAVSKWLGWDPVNGQIRSWMFDSRGGYGDGVWTRKGNTWTGAVTGVLPDGRRGSAQYSMHYDNDKTFHWQSTDREIEGEPVPDVEVKFTRKSVKP